MVVLMIIAMLVAIAAPAALEVSQGDRLRDAATSLQGVLANARDRAMTTNSAVGLRLVRMSTNKMDPRYNFVNTLLLVRRAPLICDGRAMVVHSGWNGRGATEQSGDIYDRVVLLGSDPEMLRDLPNNGNKIGQREFYGAIRFGFAGRFYNFTILESGINSSYPQLRLAEPMPAPIPAGYVAPALPPFTSPLDVNNLSAAINSRAIESYGTNYQILMGNVPIDEAAPIPLPAGIVIDIGNIPDDARAKDKSLSQLRPDEFKNFDIMFSAAGRLEGASAASGQTILWLHDATAEVHTVSNGHESYRLVSTSGGGQHALVAINATTGLTQSGQPNLVDIYNDLKLESGLDGYFDNDAYFAHIRQGVSSGM